MPEATTIVLLSCGLPLLAVIAGFIALSFTARARATRALIKTRAIPVSELTDGARVKVIGRALADDPGVVTAPATGRVALCYEVSFRYVHGQTVRGPVTLTFSKGFRVDDGTGVVRVATAGSRLILDLERQADLSGEDAPDWLYNALVESGYRCTRSRLNGHFTIEEGVLEPGETVAVVGTVERDASGNRSLVATDEAEIIISDDTDLHNARA